MELTITAELIILYRDNPPSMTLHKPMFEPAHGPTPDLGSSILGLTVVSVTDGVSVSVDRRLAPLDATVRPLVSPVRRDSKQYDRKQQHKQIWLSLISALDSCSSHVRLNFVETNTRISFLFVRVGG